MFKRLFGRYLPEPFREEDGGGGAGGVEVQEPTEPVAEETEGDDAPSPEVPRKEEPAAGPRAGSQQAADSAFAAMRRENANLRKRIAQQDSVLGLFFEGEDKIASALSRLPENERETFIREQKFQQDLLAKDEEIAELRRYKAETTFQKDLEAIRQAHPEVTATRVEDLHPDFVRIMATGQLDPVTAYEVIMAREQKQAKKAPAPIGKVNESKGPEKDTYTLEELKNLSAEEVRKNWDKVEKSRKKLFR